MATVPKNQICSNEQCSHYWETGGRCELWCECSWRITEAPAPASAPTATAKGNKYHAQQATGADGEKYASTSEQSRGEFLEMLQKAGEIKNLQKQVKFVLIPTQRNEKGELLERECSYYADFTYYDKNGNYIVEDVKGYTKGEAYKLFVIKRKLMLERKGIQIKEIKK